MEQVYSQTKDYKVLVRCMTYNQSKYIEDALNGFAMQKTDFPFVCLVMDDASTDGEQEVIKAWMERECDMSQAEDVEIERSFVTIVPHKTNESCTFAFYFLKKNLYGTGEKRNLIAPWREHCEYEALCEGDDYWIHPGKLQMQADFLDENPDYGGVHSALSFVNTESEVIPIPNNPMYKGMKKRISNGYVWHYYLYDQGFILTCTFMYRIHLVENMKPMGIDTNLFMTIARQSKIQYINETLSCYRINPKSLMNSAHDKVIIMTNRAVIRQLYDFSDGVLFDRYYRNNIDVMLKISIYLLRLIKREKSWMSDSDKSCFRFVVKHNIFALILSPVAFCSIIWTKISR